MLQPVLSVFTCDDDMLRDFVKFFFAFGKDKLRISGDFLIKNIGDLMDERSKALLESKTILEQSFDVFYKYVVVFIDECDNIPKSIGTHVEFRHRRNVVWSFLNFLVDQNDNIKIKRTVVTNHLKNNDVYNDSERFVNLIGEIGDELVTEPKPFNISTIENTFFILSKIIAIFNFVKVNNAVVTSINQVVSSNEITFDNNAVNDIQNVIEGMSSSTVASAVDELVFDEESFNIEIENLNYPIVPVTVFNDLRFFQEKRVFLFVGSSGIGKSMILCHIASEMWLNTAYKKAPREAVFYFTMENLKEEIAARITANAFYTQCGLNKTIDDVIAGNFTSTDKNMLHQKMKDAGRILIIEYLPPKIYGATMKRNLIKKHMFERGIVPYAIIDDYIDLNRCENKRVKDEHQELGEVVNEHKGLASEFSVPYISVSHLNSDGCRLVKEDMGALGGRQMGKSLRKYENADAVAFVDEESTGGLPYSIMNFFISKHRYARKAANRIYGKKYLPEYSFLGSLDSGANSGGGLPVERGSAPTADVFSDDTIGL